jgi:hypothetical protein
MKALDRKVDLEINSTLIDLIKIFVFNNQRSIYNMRILGDARLQEDVMDLIPHLTLTSIFANWKQWFNAFDMMQKLLRLSNELRHCLIKLISNALKSTHYWLKLNNIKTAFIACKNANVDQYFICCIQLYFNRLFCL